MTIGFIGLGKMGKAMALRLLKGGVMVVAYNRSADPYPAVKKEGAVIAASAQDVARRLKGRKIVWLMVPAFVKTTAGRPSGSPVDEVIRQLITELKRGDIMIDGGNSNYLDSQRRAKQLRKRGIYFLDIGTSGGITGEKDGWCFMAGGDRKAFKSVEPLLKIMSRPRGGYLYCGASGAGHLVKTVHNGIEVGMMEAIAEGFAVLEKSALKLDLAKVAEVWMKKSIIDSRLVAWAREALRDPKFKHIAPYVEGGTTGNWTLEEARRRGVRAPALEASLKERARSRKGKGTFAHRVVAALRQQFGGHQVKIRNPKL